MRDDGYTGWLEALWHEAVYEPTDAIDTTEYVLDKIVSSLENDVYWSNNNCLISWGRDMITIEDDYGTNYTITITKNSP